jgi:hypothetical protein
LAPAGAVPSRVWATTAAMTGRTRGVAVRAAGAGRRLSIENLVEQAATQVLPCRHADGSARRSTIRQRAQT